MERLVKKVKRYLTSGFPVPVDLVAKLHSYGVSVEDIIKSIEEEKRSALEKWLNQTL